MHKHNRIKQFIDLKNLLVIIGVLVLTVMMGFVIPNSVYKHRAAQPQSQKNGVDAKNQSGKITAVRYTNKGFEPQTITIPVNSAVVWTNTSEKQMWVASDPHPAHNGLPGFDQSGPEGNEEGSHEKHGFLQRSRIVMVAYAHDGAPAAYTYTFTKTGTWPYHNHLSPNDRGKVIVK